MTKQRPILFSTDMVQAILSGTKTQTRRIVKPQKNENLVLSRDFQAEYDNGELVKCPYGKPGDVLWVRETWCLTTPYGPEDYYFGYKAGNYAPYIKAPEKYDYATPDVWKPSIHMPKAACRIFLRIKHVRVEQLNKVSKNDAIAEGIKWQFSALFKERRYFDYEDKESEWRDPVSSFHSLWESINGSGSWKDNPWVWVVEFEMIGREVKDA